MSTKHMFANTIFSRFCIVWASENDSKIDVFSHFFRKRRFCENRAPVEAPCIFSGFGASQNRPKIDAKTRSNKASKKNVPKLDFGLRCGLPTPPKIHQKLKKSKKDRHRKKAQKDKARTLPQLTANHCKSSLLGPRRTIQL